ncbi:MAG: CDP-alcohol phosphatidyltransferase family protein [Acidimicrobiia bacterium]
MLDLHARKYAEKVTGPIGKALHKIGVSADALTVLGLFVAIATGFAVASGHHLLAAFGVALAGVPDLLDGAIARASGKVNSRGAFLDSLFDRISDAALYIGAVWFYAHHEHAALASLAAIAMALSLLISYARAIGEKMGFNVKGGIMERAERLIVFGVSLAVGYLYIGLWIICILGFITLIQRHMKIWKLASEANGLNIRKSRK